MELDVRGTPTTLVVLAPNPLDVLAPTMLDVLGEYDMPSSTIAVKAPSSLKVAS